VSLALELLAAPLVLGGLWFLLPFAVRKAGETTLRRRCRAQRAIVLSYDDGPGIHLTPALVELLAAYGVCATFHLLGRNALAAPALAQRLVAHGHEVGSHTQDHAHAWKTSPLRFGRDLLAGVATINGLGGQGRHFRPPHGKLTLAGMLQAAALGLRCAWWTVDSRDS